jgi:hypothetical protein
MKRYRGSRGIAPIALGLGARMGGQYFATAALSPGNNTYLIAASVGPPPVRTFGEDDNNDDDNNNNNNNNNNNLQINIINLATASQRTQFVSITKASHVMLFGE